MYTIRHGLPRSVKTLLKFFFEEVEKGWRGFDLSPEKDP